MQYHCYKLGNQERVKRAPFNTAAYVHPFRYPSAHAQQLRAIAFAKEHRQRLLWVTAFDKPQREAEAHLKGSRGAELKEEWLQLPVGRTSGIPGLFPLVVDLPIIFKECPDAGARRKGVFKNARGILRGWDLAEEELQRLAATDEPELVLNKRPAKSYTLKCSEEARNCRWCVGNASTRSDLRRGNGAWTAEATCRSLVTGSALSQISREQHTTTADHPSKRPLEIFCIGGALPRKKTR